MSFIKPRIVAWSYSRLKCWEGCPAQAKYKFLDKLPEPDSPYAARGTAFHEMAEQYIKGHLVDCPPELAGVRDWLDELKSPDTQTELQLAFDEGWKETEWFAMNVYCRVVFDAVKPNFPRITVTDHKTGKKRDEHTDQLRLYALASFMKWPEADTIDAQVIYIDQGERLRMEFHRDKLDKLKLYWDDRAARMRADDVFAPKPSPACRWCHYRKSNGGPCVFG